MKRIRIVKLVPKSVTKHLKLVGKSAMVAADMNLFMGEKGQHFEEIAKNEDKNFEEDGKSVSYSVKLVPKNALGYQKLVGKSAAHTLDMSNI